MTGLGEPFDLMKPEPFALDFTCRLRAERQDHAINRHFWSADKTAYRGFMGWLLLTLICTAGCISQSRKLPVDTTPWGPEEHGVRLSASMTNYVVTADSTIILSIKIKNSSRNVITLPARQMEVPIVPDCTEELRNGSGKIYKLAHPIPFITMIIPPLQLKARETKEWKVPVDLKRDVGTAPIKPGDYALKVTQMFTWKPAIDFHSYSFFDLDLMSNPLKLQIQ